jgi:DHA1 family tetracycline resistance protein-like MFS transporter
MADVSDPHRPDPPMSRAPGRHALAFVLVTVFIDTVGFGVIIPVLPALIAELTGGSVADAAGWGGALMFAFAAMHFLFSPVLGNLSDALGRRPILLLSLATLAVDYLIMATASSIVWLFAGRILSGISSATFAIVNAYIADVTTEDERSSRFGLVSAAWGVGFVFGPVLGGLLGEIDPRLPFWTAAGLAGVNMVYGALVLPETLPPERRRPFELRRANPVGALGLLTSTRLLTVLSGVLVLHMIAHDVHPSTWTYYVMHKFDWTPAEVGAGLAAVGLSVALVSATLVGPAVRRLGEVGAALTGFSLTAVSFAGYAFATEGWMIYPCIVLGAAIGLVMPSLRALLSRAVPADEQGALQGAIASLMGLVTIFAPLLMTQTFRFFSAADAPLYFPGAAYLLAGTLLVIAAVVVAGLARTALPPAREATP